MVILMYELQKAEHMREEKIYKNILKIINSSDRGLSFRKIAEKLKLSSATIAKYCLVLEARGELNIEDFGNIKIVKKA